MRSIEIIFRAMSGHFPFSAITQLGSTIDKNVFSSLIVGLMP